MVQYNSSTNLLAPKAAVLSELELDSRPSHFPWWDYKKCKQGETRDLDNCTVLC